MELEEQPVIQPPNTLSLFDRPPAPVLYTPDGKPMVRDTRIGFLRDKRALV